MSELYIKGTYKLTSMGLCFTAIGVALRVSYQPPALYVDLLKLVLAACVVFSVASCWLPIGFLVALGSYSLGWAVSTLPARVSSLCRLSFVPVDASCGMQAHKLIIPWLLRCVTRTKKGRRAFLSFRACVLDVYTKTYVYLCVHVCVLAHAHM